MPLEVSIPKVVLAVLMAGGSFDRANWGAGKKPSPAANEDDLARF